jgi:hypothetical protein
MCLVRLRVFTFLAAGSGHGTASSGPSALLVWLSVISTLATVAAVFFAWRAAVSARDANRYARETAQAAEEANTYARETVETTRAAHEADERDRRLRELREIGRLVESILWEAQGAQPQYQFRAAEQNQLGQALVGIDPPMPRCSDVVNAATGGQVVAAAPQARIEVEAAIRDFRAGAPKEASEPSPPAPA